MAEQIVEKQLTDLDDRATQSNVDRQSVATDTDMNTEERLRVSAADFDNATRAQALENARRDRTFYDQFQSQALLSFSAMNNTLVQSVQNSTADAQNTRAQVLRHTDHTMTDLHDPKKQTDGSTKDA